MLSLRSLVLVALPATVVPAVLAPTAPVTPPPRSVPAPLRWQPAGNVVLDSAFLRQFRWRNIGPDRGGRSIAASGVKGRPREAYFGATGGGRSS